MASPIPSWHAAMRAVIELKESHSNAEVAKLCCAHSVCALMGVVRCTLVRRLNEEIEGTQETASFVHDASDDTGDLSH